MSGLFYDPTAARLFYGAVLALACGLAWFAHEIALRKLALWMVVAWAQANLLYALMGPQTAPWLVPLINALIALAVAGLAIQHRSAACWSVVSLFVIEEAINLGAFVTHHQGATAYYLLLNAVYLLRMAVVGGAGVLAYRAARRDSRFRHRVPG